jgi:hypothetical protein
MSDGRCLGSGKLGRFHKNYGHDCDRWIQLFSDILDCGGKRSATPLSCGREIFSYMIAPRAGKSGVAAVLCHRSPKRWRDSGNLGQFNGYGIS